MRSVMALIAAFACGAAHAADYRVTDADGLRHALAGAKTGDTISLAPGSYGDLVIGPRFARGPVTITAADAASPPVFRSIFIRDSADITLRNLAVAYGVAEKPLVERAIEVRLSSAIRLEGLKVASAANGVPGDDASGVIIRDSRDVRVEASRFEHVFRGLVIFDSDAVVVRDSRFSQIGVDGIAARGAHGLAVENNLFTDFTPADAAKWHPDAVQLWSKGAARANERIVIRGNVIRRGSGAPSQGVFIKSPEFASRNVVIEGNRIEQSMGQGIFVQNAIDVTIRDNVLIAVAPILHLPAIEIRAPFENAVVENNAAPKYRLPAGVRMHGNATREDPANAANNRPSVGSVGSRRAPLSLDAKP